MSGPKHTGGRWKAVRSSPAEGADVWWIVAAPAPNQEREIASVAGGSPAAPFNASLFAAAPELLAALKKLAVNARAITTKDVPYEWRAALGAAHSAIERAERGVL